MAEMENGKKYQLVDSTALISTMFSFLYDKPEGGLESVLNCYPKIMKEDISGATLKKPVMDVQNRYFLMYQHSGPNKDTKGIVEERKWRKWVDDTLVHTLSPNVYRSPTEALQVNCCQDFLRPKIFEVLHHESEFLVLFMSEKVSRPIKAYERQISLNSWANA